MRDTLKGFCIGAFVAAAATVLLAQTPNWTAPRSWSTGDLLTAGQFNSNFRDNLLNLRANSACADSGITGTASADTVLFGIADGMRFLRPPLLRLTWGARTLPHPRSRRLVHQDL